MAAQTPLPAAPVALPPTIHPLFRLPTMDPKQRFYNHFLDSVAVLQDQIAQLQSVAAVAGERQEAIDHILAGITKLQSEVSDAAEFTPAYDRRQYAEAVKALQDTLNQTITKVTPRTRFQFKRPARAEGHVDMGAPSNDPRLNPGSSSPQANIAAPAAPTPAATAAAARRASIDPNARDYNAELSAAPRTPGLVRRPSFSASKAIALSRHAGLHVVLPSSAAAATASGSLTDMAHCVVDMSAPTTGSPFQGLALRNITGSVVVAGTVSGPVHVTAVSNSVIVVAARQVRIHECRNVDVYLQVASHPIIEDCSGMRFAPLPAAFMTEADRANENQWDQVDDFKWLKVGPSPNWTTMSEAERLDEELWTKVVKGETGASVEEVLARARIPRKRLSSSVGSDR